MPPQPDISNIPQEPSSIQQNDLWSEGEIQINAICQHADIPNIDDIFRALRELEKQQAIEIVRMITFKNGLKYVPHREKIWGWLDQVLENIITPTHPAGRELTVEEMSSFWDGLQDNDIPENWRKQDIRMLGKRIVRSAIKLCGNASLRIKETVNDELKLVYRYSITNSKIKEVKRHITNIVGISKSISNRFCNNVNLNPETIITLSNLLHSGGENISLRNLASAIRLLANLGLHNTEQELVPWSYVTVLKTLTPLTDPSNANLPENDKKMYDELDMVNKMAELRSYAMELYAYLPDEQKRQYIDDYFAVNSPHGLELLIENTVKSIDENVLRQNEHLSSILVKVRKEAIEDEINGNPDKGKPGLNKQQKEACLFPYNQHLLVNAGPGSGKTHVLMIRASYLIHQHGLQPDEILILAFNRAVVYEIKKRIISLFAKLGYGTYVKRLHVYTFHAFAMMHMKPNQNILKDSDSLKILLHNFALKLQEDTSFRDSVAQRYKAILVDEFQDMNEDFYNVIIALQKGSNAGLMVIGDDDQDILLWERLEWQNTFNEPTKLHAYEYFKAFENSFLPTLKTVNLTTNYRSGPKIVKRSQSWLDEVINRYYKRLKKNIQLIHYNNYTNIMERIDDDNEFFNRILALSAVINQSIAILCRSNSETFEMYELLRNKGITNIRVQGGGEQKISQLREIAEWLDICRNFGEDAELVLTENIFNELKEQYQANGLPNNGNSDMINNLWNLTQTEHRNASVSNHLQFLEELKISDYQRMIGITNTDEARLIVSTIHKVKGLEFDTVFIKASNVSFPFKTNRATLKDNCIEEVLLFYVAMTRAKKELYFQWKDRENHWRIGTRFNGVRGIKILEGSPEDVFISWTGLDQQYKNGLQDYIRNNVNNGDQLTLDDNCTFFHNGRQIGKLASGYRRVVDNANIRVSSVIRYPVGEKLQQNRPNIWANIHPQIKEQGWLYTVLVSGRI